MVLLDFQISLLYLQAALSGKSEPSDSSDEHLTLNWISSYSRSHKIRIFLTRTFENTNILSLLPEQPKALLMENAPIGQKTIRNTYCYELRTEREEMFISF